MSTRNLPPRRAAVLARSIIQKELSEMKDEDEDDLSEEEYKCDDDCSDTSSDDFSEDDEEEEKNGGENEMNPSRSNLKLNALTKQLNQAIASGLIPPEEHLAALVAGFNMLFFPAARGPLLHPTHRATELQRRWREVRQELDAFLALQPNLPVCGDYYNQSSIDPDRAWRVIPLIMPRCLGGQAPIYGEHFRRTLALLPETTTAAYISLLHPGQRVPEHEGITRALVRHHLCLQESAGCYIEFTKETAESADEARQAGWGVASNGEGEWKVQLRWKEGEVIAFDDTHPHRVAHEGFETTRAILLFDLPLESKENEQAIHSFIKTIHSL